MSERYLLTIGFIPDDCASENILCGDPEDFGGDEINIVIEDDVVTCAENGASVPAGDFWDESSEMWNNIIEKMIAKELPKASGITAKAFCDCWAVFMDECEDFPEGLEIVAEQDDGGEFPNADGEHNGCTYIRYQFEEDDEVWGEKVVVIKP